MEDNDKEKESDKAQAAPEQERQKKFKQGRKGRKQKEFRPGFNKFRTGRKRAQSFPAASKFFLPYKRPRKETIIPPTKFLLGGNISDPLNLNSLRDEDVNRAMNAVTPKSSPLPTPPRHRAKIDVIIPPNIRDPLNLMTQLDDAEHEKALAAAEPRRAKKRPRQKSKRRRSESAAVAAAAAVAESEPSKSEPGPDPATTAAGGGAQEPRSPAAASPASPARPSAPTDPPPPPPRKRTASESDPKKPRRSEPLDKIVSPVVPQPGAWMRVHPGRGRGGKARPPPSRAAPPAQPSAAPADAKPAPNLPKFRPEDERYRYGNYDRYYGYRNLNALVDVRLKVFELNRHLFNGKDILDVGCNVGHISIAVARDFGAKTVTGIDIDKRLIARARKNVDTFVVSHPSCCSPSKDKSQSEPPATADASSASVEADRKPENPAEAGEPGPSRPKNPPNRHKKFKRNRRAHHKPSQELIKQYYPVSCPVLYGPAHVAGFPVDGRLHRFPQNIVFKQANYVLKDENLINAEIPQYDLIMCLSVTKWIHLNWGDGGIKLAFKRMFAQLRPGGKLILEAQNWASYKKKKKLTETTYKNFSSIEFYPSKFKEYLLSPEVGFSKCVVLGVPQHLSKGFRRPIHLYIKGDFTPSKVQWSDTYAPSHHQSDVSVDEQPKKVYAYVVIPSYHPSSSRWSENNTPSYGAVTPCAYQMENNSAEESPFYNPRSDSYMPSYSGSGRPKTVYASLSSPQSDYGGTPSHVTEGGSLLPHRGVYATMASPASPFLEPSPGNSTTPSHPFTPSHSASYDVNPANKKVYASLHSPHEEIGINGRGQPIYSPSVAGTSRCDGSGGHSPLYTGASYCPVLEGNDCENANSNDSSHAKNINEHVATPAGSPASDVQNLVDSEHNSPRDSNDTE